MHFRDLLDPERVLAALMKVAVCLVILSIVPQLVICFLRQVSPAAGFAMLCSISLLSPIAYLIRQKRQGRQQSGARRGAERTPLLPRNEEFE